MKSESHCSLKNLKVDGGATKNKFLMQFQSDILSTDIMLPACLETTALGVAYLAGLASGFYKDIAEIKSIHSYQAIFHPSMDEKVVKEKYDGWKNAIEATRRFK
jgi:glycerol kinase